jgi:alkylation response protein AidB-like acyl-CoA dehydrogenase
MPTAAQLEIHALAREFASGELRPHVERWDAAGRLPDAVFEQLAGLGFLGMRIPEEHGGLGLDTPSYLLALEALSWGEPAVALALAVHGGPVTDIVRRHGSREQKARWLPRLATGEALGAFALSEPEAGSDPTGLSSTAVAHEGGWRLEGRKRWVTSGSRAGLVVLFARTGGSPGARDGVSGFLIPGDAPGLHRLNREETLGLRASDTVSLELDGVVVEPDALVGQEGDGYRVALGAMTIGRLGVAAQALGIAQSAYEHALRYAAEREQFGRPLHRFGAIQEKLAGMAIRIAQARALTLEVARRLDRAEGHETLTLPASLPAGAAMAKVAASEAAMWVTDEAVQIFGGYGYMRDYPVEKLMRDAKGTEIFEGANEVLRMLVARDAIRETGGQGS